jgi:DNA-binding response OmpR family regulator
MTARILVIEDDPAISFGLKTNLTFEGYTVEVAESRAAVQERLAGPAGLGPDLPDLIVLDLMLPDGTGFEVMDDLGRAGFAGRVLVLSARKEETDKVSALRMGADDYVTKPFSLAELLARVEALLRRSKSGFMGNALPPPAPAPAPVAPPSSDGQRIRFGQFEIEVVSRTLREGGEPVTLTRLEFDLLLYLAQHGGQALSRAQLLRDVWGLAHDGSARTVDNVIAHLRTKIGEDAERPRHLRTLRGAGYRFDLEVEDEKRR